MGADDASTDTVGLATGGDTGTFGLGALATNSVSTTAMDVVTGTTVGDIIQLAAGCYSGAAGAPAGLLANGVAGNTDATTGSSTLNDHALHVVRGTYDLSADTFVGSVIGTDSHLGFDSDATVDTQAYEAVVLVGYGQVTVTGISGAAGTVTLG